MALCVERYVRLFLVSFSPYISHLLSPGIAAAAADDDVLLLLFMVFGCGSCPLHLQQRAVCTTCGHEADHRLQACSQGKQLTAVLKLFLISLPFVQLPLLLVLICFGTHVAADPRSCWIASYSGLSRNPVRRPMSCLRVSDHPFLSETATPSDGTDAGGIKM